MQGPAATDPGRSLPDWLRYIEACHPRDIELGLERVGEVYERLFDGSAPCRTLIVGGTNGKGSCVELLRSVLDAAEYRVGAYTSPHLMRFNERVRVAGAEAANAQLCDALRAVDRARGEIPLTYFEFATLAALCVFAESGVELAIMETGLGGRLDAVNILPADAVLITNVAIDHTDWLGDSREAIAAEKAGLIKASTPLVIGDIDPPSALPDTARRRAAPVYRIERDFGYTRAADAPNWRWWGRSGGETREIAGLPKPLGGATVQLINAACALQMVTLLQDDWPVRKGAFRQGLRDARLRGRAELVATRPAVILDVAHNPAAVRALVRRLVELGPFRRTVAVCAMLADKDVETCAEVLAGRVDEWYVCGLAQPRGISAGQLRERVLAGLARDPAANTGGACVTERDDLDSALNAALAEAGDDDCIIVFGSFFTVGDIISRYF